MIVSSACHGQLFDRPGPEGGAGGGGAPSSGGNGGNEGGGGNDASFPLACDPINPSYCGFPFPSNVYAVADEDTETGLRVAFKTEGLPVAKNGHEQDPTPWSRADGFSASSAILAHFPNAVGDGLVSVLDIGASLDDGALTVVIDAETGERVPHWAEMDHHGDAEEQSLLIHPALPMRDGTRYIVAVRGLVDGSGAAIEPSPAFLALRDGEPSDEPSVEARRGLYDDDIFPALADAGIDREGLLLAWDFTTASRESNTGWLVHMRDEALSAAGDNGPAYTITSVDSDLDPANILFRIKGTMSVPLFMDDPEPGGSLIFGEDGLPAINTETPDYEVEWELLIPNIAQTEPVGLLQYGHGLLGSYEQVESEHFRTFCNTFGFAVFSTKWVGLAEEDEEWIVARIAGGELDGLNKMFERLHQGAINNLTLMRMMSRGMDVDPTYGQYLDGNQRYYWGISQGGINGGLYMSLTPDVARGTLEVMGQPYNTLLNRSVDFDPFFAIVNLQFQDPRAQQHLLGLLQMNWDRVEPSGYTKYMFDAPFPGVAPNRRVLMRTAVGDHQVTTFGGHVMARAVNATHMESGVRPVYGLRSSTAQSIDQDGAVYIEYDFGLPPEPDCNIPLDSCEDPHGELRKLDDARQQNYLFFKTGIFENRCAGQVCDHTDISGCDGTEDQDLCD